MLRYSHLLTPYDALIKLAPNDGTHFIKISVSVFVSLLALNFTLYAKFRDKSSYRFSFVVLLPYQLVALSASLFICLCFCLVLSLCFYKLSISRSLSCLFKDREIDRPTDKQEESESDEEGE